MSTRHGRLVSKTTAPVSRGTAKRVCKWRGGETGNGKWGFMTPTESRATAGDPERRQVSRKMCPLGCPRRCGTFYFPPRQLKPCGIRNGKNYERF